MIEAADEHGRMLATGAWTRSAAHFHPLTVMGGGVPP